ncbi:MAG: hypothetical protein NWQ54_11675 [Paraglaciecola sp.]|uniref:hypothetical protein n=1 Tax=Paraglaciecola sp. TaxID=1920173 RepID=UPI00273D32DD|nr:hypothetical protein [Paraglaciecola sp.]MDP5030396.1 hypothetical protein [Paraglaciecola sp.]MDP5131536.1 hypothetical protein [Paraglaciecola sp.]
MIYEVKKSGQELMRNALNELIDDPSAKINMKRVADKAGLNHALFRKGSYANIKQDIIDAQKARELELHNQSKENQIINLKMKLETANSKLKQQSEKLQNPSPKTVKETEGVMMARLVEMYRYNDLLRAELAQKYGEDINEETGEIISIDSMKRK